MINLHRDFALLLRAYQSNLADTEINRLAKLVRGHGWRILGEIGGKTTPAGKRIFSMISHCANIITWSGKGVIYRERLSTERALRGIKENLFDAARILEIELDEIK